MINARDYSYLEDMLAYARDAVSFMEGEGIDLERDRMRQFAVIRAVEVVGEAASKVSAEGRETCGEVPWRAAIGMRNVLIHAYPGIDLAVVAGVVRNEFPKLIETLDRILRETPEP